MSSLNFFFTNLTKLVIAKLDRCLKKSRSFNYPILNLWTQSSHLALLKSKNSIVFFNLILIKANPISPSSLMSIRSAAGEEVDDDTIMITVFGSQTTVGLVRFYSTSCCKSLADFLIEIRAQGPGDMNFSGVDLSSISVR